MPEDEDTTQKVKRTTLKRIQEIGSMGESFDDVIVMLLDEHDKKVGE